MLSTFLYYTVICKITIIASSVVYLKVNNVNNNKTKMCTLKRPFNNDCYQLHHFQ